MRYGMTPIAGEMGVTKEGFHRVGRQELLRDLVVESGVVCTQTDTGTSAAASKIGVRVIFRELS